MRQRTADYAYHRKQQTSPFPHYIVCPPSALCATHCHGRQVQDACHVMSQVHSHQCPQNTSRRRRLQIQRKARNPQSAANRSSTSTSTSAHGCTLPCHAITTLIFLFKWLPRPSRNLARLLPSSKIRLISASPRAAPSALELAGCSLPPAPRISRRSNGYIR